MRLLPMLLALPLFALQAHAQTAPTQPPTPAAGAVATSTPEPTATAPVTAAHHRMTWKQRFTQANLAHDGHLTLQEAEGGYTSVARHFKEIDADKKGYVTEEDILNWHKLQRAMRHPNGSRADQGLRPRPAMQHGMTTAQPITTSTDGMVLPMAPTTTPTAGK